MVNSLAIAAARLACAVHAQHDEACLPEPIARPALAAWVWARGLGWREAGALFGVSHELARLWCLPFNDPKRVEPSEAHKANIACVTAGVVPPDSFKAPAPVTGSGDASAAGPGPSLPEARS